MHKSYSFPVLNLFSARGSFFPELMNSRRGDATARMSEHKKLVGNITRVVHGMLPFLYNVPADNVEHYSPFIAHIKHTARVLLTPRREKQLSGPNQLNQATKIVVKVITFDSKPVFFSVFFITNIMQTVHSYYHEKDNQLALTQIQGRSENVQL